MVTHDSVRGGLHTARVKPGVLACVPVSTPCRSVHVGGRFVYLCVQCVFAGDRVSYDTARTRRSFRSEGGRIPPYARRARTAKKAPLKRSRTGWSMVAVTDCLMDS